MFLFLLALPSVSALTTTNDTTFFAIISNYTIYVNESISLDQVRVTDTSIEFYNLTTDRARFNNTNATSEAVASFFGLDQPVNDIRHSNGTIVSSSLSNLDINVTILAGDDIQVGDFSITSITLLSPGDNSEDTDGFVTFSYNATDEATISSCTLTIQGVERSGEPIQTFLDTTLVSGAIQSLTLSAGNNLIISNRLQWFVNCTDSLGNTGQSEKFIVDTLVGSSTGGGGGGGGVSGFVFANETLETEKMICDKVFFRLIDNIDFTIEDISNLKEELEPDVNVSISNLTIFFEEYDDKCPQINNRTLPVSHTNSTTTFAFSDCSPSFNNTFLDSSFSIPAIFKGDMSCEALDFWKWTFKIEPTEDIFEITGLKIIVPIVLATLLFSIFAYVKTPKGRSGGKLKE